MKNPTLLIVGVTLVLGLGFLGFLIVNSKDDIKQGSDVVELATKLGLDTDQFIADYESDEIAQIVEDQKADALARLGGSASTPSVFIDGEEYTRVTTETLADGIQTKLDAADDEDLPIVVEVFEDYNCSACAAFQEDLYAAESVFTADQVVIEKKHLPFLADSSTKYARAAEAARKQGMFDEYNVELFMLTNGMDYSFYPFAE